MSIEIDEMEFGVQLAFAYAVEFLCLLNIFGVAANVKWTAALSSYLALAMFASLHKHAEEAIILPLLVLAWLFSDHIWVFGHFVVFVSLLRSHLN